MTKAAHPRTVKEQTFDVLRQYDLTTLFSNPGSTEVGFLADLPADISFVLGLHEGSVVGMASGRALATGRPALVLLHTTAGYGNAVSALATARANRAPLVVIVGQQDRRHLPHEPFLAGRLDGLAGSTPCGSTRRPVRRTSPAPWPAPGTRPRKAVVRRSSSSRWTTGSPRPRRTSPRPRRADRSRYEAVVRPPTTPWPPSPRC